MHVVLVLCTMYFVFFFFFFFSSRRRHTRLVSDWSSDVCSSDLASVTIPAGQPQVSFNVNGLKLGSASVTGTLPASLGSGRSEERRVGKEGRCRGAPCH